MIEINLDQLIGEVKPVAELIYEGNLIKIFPPDDLPERFYLRYKEASAKLAEWLEMAAPEEARKQVLQMYGEVAETNIIKVDDAKIADSVKEVTKLSTIVRSQKLQATAIREWVEAIMQLPKESLEKCPASVIADMYAILQKAMKDALLVQAAAQSSDSSSLEKEGKDEGVGQTKRPPKRSESTLAA